MKELHLLDQEERKQFFEVAAYESKKTLQIVEKDYWVVWILERLFALPDLKSHLTFKGGTSLSKVFGVIERFSEDVDVSIEKDFLGFSGKDSPETASSRSQQKHLLDKLSEACSKYIQGNLLSDLKVEVASKIRSDRGWQILNDSDDASGQSLLFLYPTLSPKDGYIRPVVKIEMGARAEHWPVSQKTIQSYAKEAVGKRIHEQPVEVRVLDAERTFWEKATILHQYAHLPTDKPLPPRLSRHWYDFFRLLTTNISAKALQQIELLERVANHKKVYFASGWANYDTARKGTLRLAPTDRINTELSRDYTLMEPMFFGQIPEWKIILKTIKDFEGRFNR